MKSVAFEKSLAARSIAGGVGVAVILAGGLRPTPLAASANCSVLDLWLTPHRTVLDLWLHRIAELGEIPVRVLWNEGVPRPALDNASNQVECVEDSVDVRGPAGALRDACLDIGSEQTILVCESARFVDTDLAAMLAAHSTTGAVVTVACNLDRTPAGIYLIERPALDLIPPIGFMDLKEQWLGKVIAAGHKVFAHRFELGTSHALRTREQFLAAVRAANGGTHVGSRQDGRVVSTTASVHAAATLWDSVVMGGATIEAGAVVVRSVIGPGALVRSSDVIVDQVVGARRSRPS